MILVNLYLLQIIQELKIMNDNMTMKVTGVDYVNEKVDGVDKTFVLVKTGDTIISKIPAEEFWKVAEKYDTSKK